MIQQKIGCRILFALIFVISVRAVPFQHPPNSALDLLILHNNDMHARFEQTDKLSASCRPDEALENKCYGGFARVSHVLKEYRREAESGGPSVLYLNAGDTYTGTPWFTIFKDKIVSEFMNILKPDAISLGNHELDLGVEGLVPFLNDANFPVLVANINNTADHALWQTRALKKSVVFDIKGVKVGVVGYLTPETKQLGVPNDLEFIPEVIGINEETEALRKKGVNIIIALGHSGYDVDMDIAKNCPLVDVVIGGHSNTFLYSGQQPDIEKIDGPYPTVIKQASGKEVPVVQAYAYTKYIGELELSFDSHGNLIHWGGRPILLNGTVPRDPDVLKLLQKYRPAVYELTETVVGVTKVRLDGTDCRALECNVGNMIADAHIYTRANQYHGPHWSDVSVALVQSGGIRASVENGNITLYNLKSLLPFINSLYMLNMTGSGLLQAFEHSVSQYNGDRGEFLQVSGARVVYNMTKPPGSRVESVELRCTDCDVPTYSKLEPTKTYGTIVTNFLYEGGDGFQMFKDFEMQDMNITEFDAVQNYIQDVHTVYPAIEGRVIVHADNKPGSASRSTVSLSIVLIAVVSIFNYL